MVDERVKQMWLEQSGKKAIDAQESDDEDEEESGSSYYDDEEDQEAVL